MKVKINSPQEIQRLMAQTQFEFSEAIRKLRDLEKRKMIAEAKTTLIVTAKRVDLITNDQLKTHFSLCCKEDKFKPTIDFIRSCIYIEHQKIMEEYNYYEKQAKQAEKEYEMLVSQQIYYQSENKVKAAELMNKM